MPKYITDKAETYPHEENSGKENYSEEKFKHYHYALIY